jgi:hypothetical protein
MVCPAAQALFEEYAKAAIKHFEAANKLSNLVGQHGLFEEQKEDVERAHEKCSAALSFAKTLRVLSFTL